jgi:hypothetical protein
MTEAQIANRQVFGRMTFIGETFFEVPGEGDYLVAVGMPRGSLVKLFNGTDVLSQFTHTDTRIIPLPGQVRLEVSGAPASISVETLKKNDN